MITVLGFTEVDINTAQIAAGAYGTVYFPGGIYPVDHLKSLFPYQTWVMERNTVLLRSSTTVNSLLELTVPGLHIKGGILDGNRANNSNLGCGIVAFVDGCDLTLDEVIIQNTNYYGIAIDNNQLIMRNCTIKDTSQVQVIWRTNAVGRKAPQLYSCVFDRSRENPATMAGGLVFFQALVLNSYSVVEPRAVNCDFLNPIGNGYDTGGFCIYGAQRGFINGCRFVGGRILMSLADSEGYVISDNSFASSADYAIEMVNCSDFMVHSNFITGYSPAPNPSLYGIEVNPSCHGQVKVYCNCVRGFTLPIHDGGNKITAAWSNT